MVSAEERVIQHVLKCVDNPMFKKSIPLPLNVTSLVIQEEMRVEDMELENVQKLEVPSKDIKEKNVLKQDSPPKDIKVINVKK